MSVSIGRNLAERHLQCEFYCDAFCFPNSTAYSMHLSHLPRTLGVETGLGVKLKQIRRLRSPYRGNCVDKLPENFMLVNINSTNAVV